MIKYDISKIFMNEKVKFGPLSYTQGIEYLSDLLIQLKKVCEALATRSISHHDIRIPNI